MTVNVVTHDGPGHHILTGKRIRVVYFLLHRSLADKFMNQYIFFLADTKGAVCGLVFHCRVPPTMKMDDVGRLGQVETGSSCLER